MHSLQNKDLLCIIDDPTDPKVKYIIFTDGTWKCSHWENDDFSEWKLAYNESLKDYTFSYRHKGRDQWENDYERYTTLSIQDKALVENIQIELFFRELFLDEAEKEK